MSAMGSETIPDAAFLGRFLAAVAVVAITSSTSSRRGCVPRRPAGGNRCGTCRTCAGTRASGRRCGSGYGTEPCTWGGQGLSSSARVKTSSPNSLTSIPLLSLPEGHAEARQQAACLVVVAGGGHDRHLEPAQLVDLVVVDLGEHDLLAQAQRVVAAAVEALGVDAAKVADARQRDVEQLVEEVPHAAAAKRGLDADGLARAQLERGHR